MVGSFRVHFTLPTASYYEDKARIDAFNFI